MKERYLVIFFVSFMIVLQAVLNSAYAQEEEIKKKTQHIINLKKLVIWPKIKKISQKMDICSIGKDSFSHNFEAIFIDNINESCYRREINKISSCSILFIHDSEKDNLKEIFTIAKKNNILTVSELENFTADGGMIGLSRNENDKFKIKVNYEVAKEAGLIISAKLLKIATK
jgi:hypothetical protein